MSLFKFHRVKCVKIEPSNVKVVYGCKCVNGAQMSNNGACISLYLYPSKIFYVVWIWNWKIETKVKIMEGEKRDVDWVSETLNKFLYFIYLNWVLFWCFLEGQNNLLFYNVRSYHVIRPSAKITYFIWHSVNLDLINTKESLLFLYVPSYISFLFHVNRWGRYLEILCWCLWKFYKS